MTVNVGEQGSELKLKEPGTVRVSANVAALLDREARFVDPAEALSGGAYWSLERARIGESRAGAGRSDREWLSGGEEID